MAGDSGLAFTFESVAVKSRLPVLCMVVGGPCWQVGFPVGRTGRNRAV